MFPFTSRSTCVIAVAGGIGKLKWVSVPSDSTPPFDMKGVGVTANEYPLSPSGMPSPFESGAPSATGAPHPMAGS